MLALTLFKMVNYKLNIMGKKIVVIDDNKFVLEVVSYILDNSGYHVEIFNKAEGVLGHLEQNQPQLVIIDIGLPDADGRDVCRQIKASPATADIPVIVCSGRPEIKECLTQKWAPDDVLAKPFDINQLISAVQCQILHAA